MLILYNPLRHYRKQDLRYIEHRLHPWGLAPFVSASLRTVAYHPHPPDPGSLLYREELMKRWPKAIGYFRVSPKRQEDHFVPGIPSEALEGPYIQKNAVVLKRYGRFLSKHGFWEQTIERTLQRIEDILAKFLVSLETALVRRKATEIAGKTIIKDVPFTVQDLFRFPSRKRKAPFPLPKPHEIKDREVFVKKGKGKEKVQDQDVEVPKDMLKMMLPEYWWKALPQFFVCITCPFCGWDTNLPTTSDRPWKNREKKALERIRVAKVISEFVAHLFEKHGDTLGEYVKYSREELVYAIARDLERELFRHLYYPEKIEVSEEDAQRAGIPATSASTVKLSPEGEMIARAKERVLKKEGGK